MGRFKIGKEVLVVGDGGCYTGYPEFFDQNRLEQFEKDYICGKTIAINNSYTVVAKGIHEHGQKMVVLQDTNGDIYLMDKNKEDIKKAKKVI